MCHLKSLSELEVLLWGAKLHLVVQKDDCCMSFTESAKDFDDCSENMST